MAKLIIIAAVVTAGESSDSQGVVKSRRCAKKREREREVSEVRGQEYI